MQKETIFYLEGRGGMWPYHFFIYNLGGLCHIINNKFNLRRSDSVSLTNYKSKMVGMPSDNLKFPIKIHMTNVLPFQREAFEIIKDKFELIEDLSTIENFEIVSIYGTLIYNNCKIDDYIYSFIRKLFLENVKFEMIPKKRIFITRHGSETQHDGVLKRAILNERELISILNKYNFEYVVLEKLNCLEKIKIFMESETILSSHSGCLTFSLFANSNCKIVEIVKNGTVGFYNCHYVDICKALNLNYNRYQNIIEDANGNFNLNVVEFEKYLVSLL
jgi:hypothetical protein